MTFEAIDDLLTASPDDAAWELFHENSKLSRHERHSIFPLPPSDAMIVRAMNSLRPVKPYRDFAKIALPTKHPAGVRDLDQTLTGRVTARDFGPGALGLPELAKILFTAYGITRDNAGTDYPRPFRTIPSGGALYPLEIYLHATRVDSLEPGLYHYDPLAAELDVLRTGDDTRRIAAFTFQPRLVLSAAAILFVSAVFHRSTFKYSDRGYRFVLIEAGHLAQNALLAATGQDLAGTPLGGYLDRDADRYLGLDGLAESVVYMLLLGNPVS